MNGAVLPVLAFYIVAAEEQGVAQQKLTGEEERAYIDAHSHTDTQTRIFPSPLPPSLSHTLTLSHTHTFSLTHSFPLSPYLPLRNDSERYLEGVHGT
jgi:methylmalonyl-CoA mutase N-terminal domain/subunit